MKKIKIKFKSLKFYNFEMSEEEFGVDFYNNYNNNKSEMNGPAYTENNVGHFVEQNETQQNDSVINDYDIIGGKDNFFE